MPGPFPGMDPYLEHPVLWPLLQQYFITRLADILTEVVPRRYQVRIQERVYCDVPDQALDAALRTRQNSCGRPTVWPQVRTAEDMAAGVAPPWYIATTSEEVREPYLEIVPAAEPGPVLTVIEFLSFANKTMGSRGCELYRQQQRQRLADDCHLLEIDLLRWGRHTVLAPWERILRRGHHDYLVSLSRCGGREFCEVWGLVLREPLPKVAVPLAPTDPDVVLDLQTLLQHCYEAGNFLRRIDHDRDPFVPLARSDAFWAEQRLLQYDWQS